MDMQFCAPPSFGPVFSFNHVQGTDMHYQEGQYQDGQFPINQGFGGVRYMYSAQQYDQLMHERNPLGDGKTESKPRLSKEEVEKLEKVFQENSKPSSSVKAQLADGLGLERPRINNWFQNRRAKAKQERKQEEYEARRTAEKGTSEPNLPVEPASGVSEFFSENVHQRMKPSSALFPNVGSAPSSTEESCDNNGYEDDAAADVDELDSPFAPQSFTSHQDDLAADWQSPLSLDMTHSDKADFMYSQPNQSFNQQDAAHNFAPFIPSQQDMELRSERDGLVLTGGLMSPEDQAKSAEYQSDSFLKLVETAYSTPGVPFFQTTPSIEEHKPDIEVVTPEDRSMQAEQSTPQGFSTPVDSSFKSPPPPANIATRRNIARPAALNAVALRSRSYNLGCGPKTAMDGPRRADPSSPATAMRRIASNNGPMSGRIQKSAGPRSPMFFKRNHEALLQFHSQSPVSAVGTAFTGAAPPTPMTPMVLNQQNMLEPPVSSNCSDDETFMLGATVPTNFMHEVKGDSLKTPPGTPGLMTNFGGHPFSAGLDFTQDQPLLTPYFQTEFPDISLRNIPSYVDLSDNSLPTTPLYPNMMSTAQDPSGFICNSLGSTREYDWDANEAAGSSKSSPGQSRPRAIQFTPNITPQDYTTTQ